jgi:hypothetical protein
MRRNPSTKTPHRPRRIDLRGCQTPGAMLVKLMEAAPPESSLKLIDQAAKVLKAEAEAGMWWGAPPPARLIRRQR